MEKSGKGFWYTLIIFGFCFSVEPGHCHHGNNPNILFVLVDDMGWSDPSCYGNPVIQTPNIDQLARDGMRFTNAYADPVCAPSRAAIQTGLSSARLRMTGVPNGHRRPWAKLLPPEIYWQLPLEYHTIAEVLSENGYVSGIFGKWHLGYDEKHQPDDQGYVFPRDIPLTGEYADQVTAWVENNPYKGIGKQVMQSVQFLEQYQNQPFFCFVSYNMVHTGLEARPELVDKYKEIMARNRTVIHPVYAAMCETVDETLALFDDVLETLGIAQNTVLIFASDNGGVVEERGFLFHGFEELVTHNWPLKGEKGSLYEGGVRVPMIVRWPGKIQAGSESADPMHLVDLFPTFLEITGSHEVKGRIKGKGSPYDGRSIVDILTGKPSGEDRDIFWHYPHYHHSRPASAIRSDRYKLIHFYEDGRSELYDLETDIGEWTDISYTRPEVVRELAAKLENWLEDTEALLPVDNPEYNYDLELLWGPRLNWQEIRESNRKYGL